MNEGGAERRGALHGRRILVVEDDYLIAETLRELLEQNGAQVVGPIGSLEEALAFVQGNSSSIEAAVLDVNLHGKKSYPIADVLMARDIAIVFATGYGPGAIDAAYRRFPRCEKPINHRTLVAILASAIKTA
jgi:DNA-binding LytR/AlgR family response regulator